MKVGMVGVMNLFQHRSSPGIKKIMGKFARNIPLNPWEKKKFKKDMIFQYSKPNLIMDRMIDRFSAAICQSPTQVTLNMGGAYGRSDVLRYEQMREEIEIVQAGTGTSSIYCQGMIPEIMGIGSGVTAPTVHDARLETPFVIGATHRNTYNSKEGGTYGLQDNIIMRCGSIWDETYTSPGFINEVGLYTNPYYLSLREFVNVAGTDQIDFTRGGMGNMAWEIHNITLGIDAGTDELRTLIRCDTGGLLNQSYTFDRNTQLIVYNGGDVQPTLVAGYVANSAIISFSPHVLHAADAVSGSNIGWVIPSVLSRRLFARVVLPYVNSLQTGINDVLTIVWVFYFRRTY